MKIITVLAIYISLFGCARKEIKVEFEKEIIGLSHRVEHRRQFSILQGVTDSNTTQFRVVYPKMLKLTSIKVLEGDKEVGKVLPLQSLTRDFSIWAIKKIAVSGLKPNVQYRLKINSNNSKWKDERNFKMFDTSKTNMKFVVSSCASDSYNEIGNIIWDRLESHKPDYHLMIGDNIYADIFNGVYAKAEVTPTHLWNRYMDAAMQFKLYRQKNLIPTLASWDDHDYGVNNGGKTYRYKKESKKLFHHFFAQNNSKLINYGPGLSYQITLAGKEFIFLDARTFRDAEDDKNGGHLGSKQRQWLRQTLAKTTGLTFLTMGDQYFGAYHSYESFEGQHPVKFKSFLKDLRAEQDNKIIFMSGDRHLVEVMDIEPELLGYKTREYTVSGVHTKLYPGSLASAPNKRRVGGIDGTYHFAIMSADSNSVKFEARNEMNDVVVKSSTLEF